VKQLAGMGAGLGYTASSIVEIGTPERRERRKRGGG